MPTNETQPAGANDFAVSHLPIVSTQMEPASGAATVPDYETLGELPRRLGAPVLFAIARDPHTLFAYWEIDWPRVFGDQPPPDRQVHLRALSADGLEETTAAVEPLAGNHALSVAHADAAYRIELGYHAPDNAWHSVALSDPLQTPPDGVADERAIDVATVPFHLSFQRLVDTFRGSRYDGKAIVEVISELQARADAPTAPPAPTGDHRELLRAIETSLTDTSRTERFTLRAAPSHFASRRRVEAILGFGATSPM